MKIKKIEKRKEKEIKQLIKMIMEAIVLKILGTIKQ